MFSLVNIYPHIIGLTRVKAHLHLVNQDVNLAGDSLHNIIRNSVHNDVTVPRYLFVPGWKRKVKKILVFTLNHTKVLRDLKPK